MNPPPAIDRAAAVRAALRTVVAEHGLHGASMAKIAAHAGVATGTAYTYYTSKDDVVVAAYLESKHALCAAATAHLDPGLAAGQRFTRLWCAAYEHLVADPAQARFLAQVALSPYARQAHALAMADATNPLLAVMAAPDLAARLLPLPAEVLYELSIGAAVRLAAGGVALDHRELATVAAGCWRAITHPAPGGDTEPG